MVHEITRETFDRGRVLARRHVDDIVLHEIGDHGDVIAAPAAGLVDANWPVPAPRHSLYNHDYTNRDTINRDAIEIRRRMA